MLFLKKCIKQKLLSQEGNNASGKKFSNDHIFFTPIMYFKISLFYDTIVKQAFNIK